jgi:hypothetical protein
MLLVRVNGQGTSEDPRKREEKNSFKPEFSVRSFQAKITNGLQKRDK